MLERLRINLDANTKDEIHEIKTYNYENGFDINSHSDYIEQVQVQMYGSGIHKAKIDTYGLIEEEYINYFEDIELKRLISYDIEYNEKWIKEEYLPRITILIKCLKEMRFPTQKEIKNIR